MIATLNQSSNVIYKKVLWPCKLTQYSIPCSAKESSANNRPCCTFSTSCSLMRKSVWPYHRRQIKSNSTLPSSSSSLNKREIHLLRDKQWVNPNSNSSSCKKKKPRTRRNKKMRLRWLRSLTTISWCSSNSIKEKRTRYCSIYITLFVKRRRVNKQSRAPVILLITIPIHNRPSTFNLWWPQIRHQHLYIWATQTYAESLMHDLPHQKSATNLTQTIRLILKTPRIIVKNSKSVAF